MPMEDKISKYIKEWMLDWEQDLQSRPQDVIASASGRQADVRYRETQEYLRPLYSRLKNRSLEPALLAGIKLIIDLMRQRNYLHAYKVYMGVAIGNAPTALFRLLEMLDAGAPHPAAIIGMPVGFVGAAESKDALMADGRVPCIIVRGRKGGSAMTVAAINALASDKE
jgi:hypothetical protein